MPVFESPPAVEETTAYNAEGTAVVFVRDCGNYHGLGPGWYRIGVRLREENEELIDAMGALR